MAAGGYQGDLLELQKTAYARWQIDWEQQQTALSKLRAAQKLNQETNPDGITIDPLLFIRNLVNIRQRENTQPFDLEPLNYGKGELLELQAQIFKRWRESDEYKNLLRSRKRKKKAPEGLMRELEWWEWIPISSEYIHRATAKKVVGPGEGPGDPGFKSAEYKGEAQRAREHQRWDNETRDPYKSREYNDELTEQVRLANAAGPRTVDWDSRPLTFPVPAEQPASN